MNGGPASLAAPSVTRKVVPSSVGLGASAVADAVVGGHRFPDARQRHGVGHVQVPGEEVDAPRGHDRAAARLAQPLERLLEGGRVVGLAVAFAPKSRTLIVSGMVCAAGAAGAAGAVDADGASAPRPLR